jgi:hypothetical protein
VSIGVDHHAHVGLRLLVGKSGSLIQPTVSNQSSQDDELRTRLRR